MSPSPERGPSQRRGLSRAQQRLIKTAEIQRPNAASQRRDHASAPSKPPQINARARALRADPHERSSDPSNPPKINAWNAGKDKQAYGNVPAATSTWDVGGRDDSCHPVPANWSVESIEDSYTAGGFIAHGAKLLGKAVGTERSANRERVDARRGGDSRCGRSLNLLFDFGAAKFSSSVGQLMHVYQPEMHFDHVFAWEANEGVFVVPRELGEEGRCERLSDDGPVVSYFNAIVSDHAQPDEASRRRPPRAAARCRA